MKIVYLFDIVCPWCYIGKKYFDKIDNRFSNKIIDITWQPYFLNPNLNPKGVNRRKYLNEKFGGEKNANYIYNNLNIAGKKAGIKFNFSSIKVMPNSLNIMYLITLIKNYKTASLLIDQLFKAFFENGENIGNLKILSKYAVKYLENFDLNLFDNYLHKNYLLQADKEFKIKGVSGVPGIIVNKKHFISGAVETEKLNKLFAQMN